MDLIKQANHRQGKGGRNGMKDEYHVLSVVYHGVLLLLFQTWLVWKGVPYHNDVMMSVILVLCGTMGLLYVAVEGAALMLQRGGWIACWPVIAITGLAGDYVLSVLISRYYLLVLY